MSSGALPAPTDFSQFQFKSIGKEPGLLARFSTGEPAPYQHSPSPSPQPENENASSSTVSKLNRPTLFQALAQSSNVPLSLPHPIRTASQGSSSFDELGYPEPDEPLPPPFVPDYNVLKDLHGRLDGMQSILAAPPAARAPRAAPPQLPQPSLVAADNAVHHSSTLQTATQELLQASQTRVSTCEQSVAAAQAQVYALTQALSAAQSALDIAQKSLVDARQAADDAKGVAAASRTTAEAVANTRHILNAPPPARSPTPEPVNPHAGIVGDMKRVLDGVKSWLDASEAGHTPPPVSPLDSQREELKRQSTHANNVPVLPTTAVKVKIEEDSPHRLVTSATDHQAHNMDREAILRQQQDAKREQIRLDKIQANQAAAKSILKEREEAEGRSKPMPASSSQVSPSRHAPTALQHLPPGAAVVAGVAAPSSSAKAKSKGKQSNVTSGAVTFGAGVTPGLHVRPAQSTRASPSTSFERAPSRTSQASSSIGSSSQDRPRSIPPAPAHATQPTSKQASKNKKVVPSGPASVPPVNSKPTPGSSKPSTKSAPNAATKPAPQKYQAKPVPTSKPIPTSPAAKAKLPSTRAGTPSMHRSRTPEIYREEWYPRDDNDYYNGSRYGARQASPAWSTGSYEHYHSRRDSYTPPFDYAGGKRARDSDYEAAYSQKRFKHDDQRTSLELRLDAAPETMGYHPQSQEEYMHQYYPSHGNGLLARLSGAPSEPPSRGRGGGRAVRGTRGRGRGRGRGLADRMD